MTTTKLPEANTAARGITAALASPSNDQTANANIRARSGTTIAKARMVLAAIGRPSCGDAIRETNAKISIAATVPRDAA